MRWRDACVAEGRTHHVLRGRPLYELRFDEVLAFHEPGLAPVRSGERAWHIRTDGSPAYERRFRETFGFYEGRAAVVDEEGWLHVLADGSPLSGMRHQWAGNYQGARCVVRGAEGYFHIDRDGRPTYAERHLYAGDYREGRAVVRWRDDGLCGHVDESGRPAHPVRFLDLDVYHQGFARARDAAGWHHVDRGGKPAYEARFSSVEPFYNGCALAWPAPGRPVLIDTGGQLVRSIHPVVRSEASGELCKLLIVGNVGAGKTTLATALVADLGWTMLSIDSCRREHGDGSPEGELRAWAAFVARAGGAEHAVIECTGVGPQVPLLELALRESGGRIGVLLVRTPADVCMARLRPLDVPYPDFGVPLDRTVREVEVRLAATTSGGGTWGELGIGEVDGRLSAFEVHERALELIDSWLEPRSCET